ALPILKFCKSKETAKEGEEGASAEKDPNIPSNDCPNCLGSGKLTGGAQMTPRDCPKCNGTGKWVSPRTPGGN
ncbi:MAG: hypothetical protein HY814_00300, partial [Candidatus Riflebacteria bacterium]|nr:hypothetical protein [Candidatus Riflebacteria bacterium]